MWPKIKQFWNDYETKIILILGFILVSVLSFEAGLIKGREIKENPVVIETPAKVSSEGNVAVENASQAPNLAQEAKTVQETIVTTPQNCAFVGSKNSNKYHLPTCRWAKQIKPENIVCFKDAGEAQAKGYLPDKNCIK